MLYLGKIFIQLTSPLGLCMLLAPTGMLLLVLGRRKIGWTLLGGGLSWLLIWSLPEASFRLRAGLERQIPQRAAADYPLADAIVVLGGGIEGARKGWRDGPHVMAPADRVRFAAQLFRAGRAPVIVLAGGNTDWSAGETPEAQAMADFIEDLGVPATALLLEEHSRSTWENAAFAQPLLAEHHLRSVLLVTSAMHMPRALAVFRKVGIDVIPAPTDFEAVPPRGALLGWLPDTQALDGSSRAFKEYFGLWAYRLRGMAQ